MNGPRTEPPHTATGDPAAPARCANCDAPLQGLYCHACGARRVARGELSVRHLAHEVFQEFVDLEHSKLFNTLSALCLRPGLLTTEYLAGRRPRYVRPLRLFLLMFAVTFIAYSVYEPVAVYDVRQGVQIDETGGLRRLVTRIAERQKLPEHVVLERLNDRWQQYLNASPIATVAAFAALLALVYRRSRRYFAEHFVFSLHYVSFTLLSTLILWPVYAVTGLKIGTGYWLLFAVTVILWLWYLYYALRTVYGQRRRATAVKTVILCLAYFAISSAISFITLSLAFWRVTRA